MDTEILGSLWVEKYRPHTLDDIILPERTRRVIEGYVEKGVIEQHLFLCSRPGQGKTSLAKLLAYDIFKVQTLYINASQENDVETIREKVAGFTETLSFDGRFKLVILDECDNFASKSSQKMLRGLMEETADTTRFILTANYAGSVIEAVRSRCVQLDVTPPKKDVIRRMFKILREEGVDVGNPAEFGKLLIPFVDRLYPDVRSIVKRLQLSVHRDGEGGLHIDLGGLGSVSPIVLDTLGLAKEGRATELREELIAREAEFDGDYQALVGDVARAIISDGTLDERRRVAWTVRVVDYLSRFSEVADPELHATACLWSLAADALAERSPDKKM